MSNAVLFFCLGERVSDYSRVLRDPPVEKQEPRDKLGTGLWGDVLCCVFSALDTPA